MRRGRSSFPNDDGDSVPIDEFGYANDYGGGMNADALGLTPAAQLLALAGSGAVGDDEDHQVSSEDVWEPHGLPTRRKERKILGKAVDRDECFFCARKGERNAVPMDRAEFDELVEFMRENFGVMKPALLAIQLSEQFELLRTKYNAERAHGQEPLPPMSAATVLKHLRGHTHDIECKQANILDILQESREELTGMLFEKSKKTKRKRPNRTAFQCLDQVVKLELLVHGKDVTKMSGYSAGARTTGAVLKGGPVSSDNKHLYDFFEKRAK